MAKRKRPRGFPDVMTDAFDQLKIQLECDHVWSQPREEQSGYGRHTYTVWAVRCRKCDFGVSRRSLEELQAKLEEMRGA